jgi:hypothetical protein
VIVCSQTVTDECQEQYMKQVTYNEVTPGRRYRVVQSYKGDTTVETVGIVRNAYDEFLAFDNIALVDVHTWVGMPNVEIWEV